MIILEGGPLKHPTGPSIGPTNRAPPQTDIASPSSSPRPPSPNPTLPDYETSQAQRQPLNHRRWGGRKFWHTRVGKLISYALVVYSSIIVVIGVPAFVLRARSSREPKFKWHTDDPFADYGPPLPPPQPQVDSQMDMSSPTLGETSISCNTWAEPAALPGDPTTTNAVMRLAFPLVEGIALRINSSSDALKGYVSGTLTVDVNQEINASSIVLMANARYSNFQLFEASSVCLTHFSNTTEIMIYIPPRAESSSDTIELDLQLLLPRTPTSFGTFVTHLPMFKQVLGNLSHASFETLKLKCSSSPITVGSISAASVIAQTSDAEISGNFSVSDKIYLDTVNGAVSANVTLHNNNKKKKKKNTRLSVETGNGPILMQVKLAIDEPVYFTAPKHQHFVTKFRTFNAPMNVSVAHVRQSQPARIDVTAENSQGSIDLSLDHLYMGTFYVRTKSATAQVLETPSSDSVTSSSTGDDDDDDMHQLHFAHLSTERARGWIGDSRRPEQFDHHALSRVELRTSLSPIKLHVARLRPPTTIRR